MTTRKTAIGHSSFSSLILETSASWRTMWILLRISTATIIGYLRNNLRPWQLFDELSLKLKWDFLTTTIDSQIIDKEEQHPARWLAQLSSHYLREEPVIQSTHNFLRLLKQDPGTTIQQWHTSVRLEYQKCNFPSAVDDRLQRDIFLIGLNDTFKSFRSNLTSRENLTTLTFAQVISKAHDFEVSLNTESAITRQLEESVYQVTAGEDTAYKVTPNAVKSKTPRHSSKPQGALGCFGCGWTPHAARCDCPAANDTCHRCGKQGHWQQVCWASTANTVTQAVDTDFEPRCAYVTTHHVAQVQSASRGIFVDTFQCSPPWLLQNHHSNWRSSHTVALPEASLMTW